MSTNDEKPKEVRIYTKSYNTNVIKTEEKQQSMVRSVVDQGPPGKSAYQHALDQGFVGTIEEWMESLKGSSAYQVALNNGFVGTEQEWLDSLILGLSVQPEDTGKYLTNNGSETIWESLQTGINKEEISIDEGSL